MADAMIDPVNFHFQTKLPEEYKKEFFRQLDLHNLRRVYIFAWVIGVIFAALLVVDYMRLHARNQYPEKLYEYLLYIHLAGLFFFVFAALIKFQKEAFESGKYNTKFLIHFFMVFLALTGPPQDIFTFQDKREVYMYLSLLLLTNWTLNLRHRFRIVFTGATFFIMLTTIFLVGRHTQVKFFLNLLEISGFTIAAFIFGTIDYNFRVSSFLDKKLLEQDKKKIEELEKFKSNLYMNLTHEFRTPLTLIMGMTELVREHARTSNKKALDEDFRSIERNSLNLLNLINQMLDLAKVEAQSMELQLEQKDIVAFLKSLITNFQSFTEEKNIDLTLESTFESFYLDFDEEKMYSILSNLLSNALKFTPDDGAVSIKISTINNKEQEWLMIKISDTGYGIGKEHLPHIFDRFYQAETGPTRNATGTGIGLALTKELVLLMGGSIKAKSELGKGAQFTVHLPVTKNTPKAELGLSFLMQQSGDKEESRKKLKKQNLERPLILLVEDNSEVLDYLATLLEDDYLIELARDGEEGTEKAMELIPDLIISDVMMPKKDGFALCSELKQDEKTNHIPIILLTARGDTEGRLTGLETGADAYLTKPFKKKELYIHIHKLMELRAKLQEKYRHFALIDKPEAQRKENNFIHKINSLLEDNLDNPDLSVEEVAKGIFMSRMQLHRKLKAVSNRSASNYIRTYRLHKARPLLQDQARKIGDVAYEVGFQDPNYFSKAFQKEFGITPSEFRAS